MVYYCGHVSKQHKRVKSALRDAADKNTPSTNFDRDCTRQCTGIRDVETLLTAIFVHQGVLGGRIPSSL